MKKWLDFVCNDLIKWLLILVSGYICIKLVDQSYYVSLWVGGILKKLSPFLWAFLFAYFLNPLMKLLEKKLSLSRGKSVLLTYVLVMIFLTLFIWLLGPMIYTNATELVKQTPTYMNTFIQWFRQLNNHLIAKNINIFEPLYDQIVNISPTIMEFFNTTFTSFFTFFANFVTGTGNVILGFLVSIYILLSKESFFLLATKISTLVIGMKGTTRFKCVLKMMHINVGRYLVGKFICSIFVGVCCVIGIFLFKGKYALLLGLVFLVTNMVPLIGPIVGMVIIVGLHLFINPLIASFLLIYLFVVQEIESLVVDPKCAGKKVGLSPFFTILSVILGGAILGIPGMILGVPICGVLKTLMIPWIDAAYRKKLGIQNDEIFLTPSE